MKSPTLFPKTEIPRTKRIVRMHVIDAGGCCGSIEPGEQNVRYRCRKCGAESDWETAASVSEAKRGKPCHNCN